MSTETEGPVARGWVKFTKITRGKKKGEWEIDTDCYPEDCDQNTFLIEVPVPRHIHTPLVVPGRVARPG